jgi:hypothetical protein
MSPNTDTTNHRPILRLRMTPPQAQKTAADVRWKCKPCGTSLQIDPNLAGDEDVRCPARRARLGRAEQFRSNPGGASGVRARLA